MLNLALPMAAGIRPPMTDIHITPKYAEVKPQGFYVYLHRRATDGSVFYVGKGKGKRAWSKSKSDCRSDHWINCAKKNGVIVEIVESCMEEKAAFLKEREIIAILKYIDLDIVNQSLGGVGPIGMKVSDETKEKISNAFVFPVWNDLGEVFKNNCEAARVMRERGYPKAAPSAIQAACIGVKSKTAYGHSWSKNGVPKKPKHHGYAASNASKMTPVVCVENGLKFQSGSDAARWVSQEQGRSASGHRVLTCAKGKSNTAYGYKWRLYEDE